MKRVLKNSSLTALTVVAMMVLFSCESNFKEVQRINSVAFSPSGEADDVDLKYTDSGKSRRF